MLGNVLSTIVPTGRKKKEKEDTFGQNDEDWHIYREIVSYYVICGKNTFTCNCPVGKTLQHNSS